jgi:hypothetical protein
MLTQQTEGEGKGGEEEEEERRVFTMPDMNNLRISSPR